VDFVNASALEAGWTMGFDREGRELLVIAIKETFAINGADSPLVLAKEQVPLTEGDVYTGEPGFSATLYETDYAHRKPKCDVLLNCSAYAPRGEPAKRVPVSLRIGPISKSFDVVGNRVWQKSVVGPYVSQPEPFTVMPITYDVAWGGVDKAKDDPLTYRWYPTNHAGRGYHEYTDGKFIDGAPLPNTEEIRKPTTDPRGRYRPMAYGAIGRSWEQRARFAGTYDQHWLEHRAPFWPDDFDYRFFNAAPEDQQIATVRVGEEVVLTNLTPEGFARFQIPEYRVPVVIVPTSEREREIHPVVDTLLIEPDHHRIMLTLRCAVPMKKSVFDIRRTVVGESLRSVRSKRSLGGKKRYANLDEMIKSKLNTGRNKS